MKKIIALLLSVIMLLTAIPMVSAASFKDSADIAVVNVEAVDIVSDLKIVSGFPEGDFKPNESLTRAQAAKILCCVMLGTEKAEALAPAGPTFSDVPAYHWANKFVEYCASKGVVSGVGSGKFDPNGKLTGYAFGKMLLVALGADASAFAGAGWDKAVQTQLKEKRLHYGVTVTGQDITRQDASHLVLNILFNGEELDVEGTLAYKVFGVVRASAGTNTQLYGRPLIKYTSNDGDVYWEGTDKQITASPIIFKKSGKIKGGELYDILGFEVAPAQLIQFHNGAKRKALKETNIVEGNKNTFSYTHNGIQSEYYYAADTGKLTQVSLWQYAEKIASVTPAVIAADGTVETPGMVAFENGWSCESNDFTETDIGNYACVYVLGTKSINKPQKAIEAYRGTIVSGKLTKYDVKKGITIDGKLYKFSGRYGVDSNVKKYVADGGAVGDEVNLLLSNDNYALAIWKK